MLMVLSLLTIGAVACAAAETETTPVKIDMSAWQHNSEDDVYWQTGLSYVATPADADYETMGVFVPGAYFNATDNGDGTYTCTVNEEGQAG